MIESGRYYYNNKPIIGQLGDIYMWDRVLGNEELERFSGCLDIVEGNENVIKRDTAFNITGKLVTKTDIQGTSVSCKKMWSLLHIPFHRASLSGASVICNKIVANSIG